MIQKEYRELIERKDVKKLKELLSLRRCCDRYGFLLTKDEFCEWLVSTESKSIRDEYPYKELWHWDDYDKPIAFTVKMLAEMDFEQKPKDGQGIYYSQESKDFIIGASIGEYGQLFEYMHGRFLDERYKFAPAYSQYQAMLKLHDDVFLAMDQERQLSELEKD